MPVRVEQPPDLGPGRARLRGQAPDGLAAGTTEIRIVQVDGGSPRFLDPRCQGDQAWGAAECWFRPESGAAGPGLTLGPSVTWHLKPHMPYLVAFRDASGKVIEDRMSWPAIRLPSDAPPPSSAKAATTSPAESAESAGGAAEAGEEDPLAHFTRIAAEAGGTEPEPVAPGLAEPLAGEPDPAGTPAPDRGKDPGRGRLVLVTGLLLLVAGAAVLAFYEPGFLLSEKAPGEPGDSGDPAVAAAPARDGPELTLEGARAFLQGQPPADRAMKEAGRFAAAGRAEAAFLLTAYAARAGDAEAALRLGDLYNPASWTEGVLKAPDAERAAEYYRAAAEAGIVEAMEKLAALLESGRLALDDAPERAAFWRRKAGDAGKAAGEAAGEETE